MFVDARLLFPHAAAILTSAFMLVSARRWPRLARVEYLALFAWACWVNWTTVTRTPTVYLEYGGLAVVPAYRNFIDGPFRHQIVALVGAIATCQGFIALGLACGGRCARAALVGATAFLVAIAPLGVGSGFPSTLFMAAGALLLRPSSALDGSILRALRRAT